MLKQVIIALVIGAAAAFWAGNYHEYLCQKTAAFFKHAFEHSLECEISFTSQTLHFFNAQLELGDVQVRPHSDINTPWTWRCNTFVIGFSWVSLLIYGILDLTVSIDHITATSDYTGDSLAIIPHLKRLARGPCMAIAMYLKSLSINNGTLIANSHNGNRLELHLRSKSRKINEKLRSVLTIADTTCVHNAITYIIKQASLTIDTHETIRGTRCAGHIDSLITMPDFYTAACYVSGRWEDRNGRFLIHSVDDTLICDPLIIATHHNTCHVRTHARANFDHVPASLLARFGIPSAASGTGTLDLHAKINPYTHIDAQITGDHIKLGTLMPITTGKIVIAKRDTTWQAQATGQVDTIGEFLMTGTFNEHTRQGACTCVNTSALTIPGIAQQQAHIPAQQIHVSLTNNADGTITGHARGALVHQGHVIDTRARIHAHHDTCTINGMCGATNYTICAKKQGTKKIMRIACVDVHKQPLMHNLIVYDEQQSCTKIKSALQLSFIRSLLAHTPYAMPGEGIVTINGCSNYERIRTHIQLKKATIRVGQTYNFVDDVDLSLDYIHALRILRAQGYCSLHQGKLFMPGARLDFTSKGQIVHAYVPLFFERCLANIHDDLFCVLSGRLLFEQHPYAAPQVNGAIVIERGRICENILTDALKRKVRHISTGTSTSPLASTITDISLETTDPLRVQTPFLQANATCQLRVTGPCMNPLITGNVKLVSGSLMFPYRPLYITHGTLTFLPDQHNVPFVDLTARNTVKHHTITLHATGSLGTQHVLLESSPTLSEEQIASLLLLGSYHDSLNIMAPALLAQNVHKLLFGIQTDSMLHRYLGPLFKPVSIRFIPSFMDQSGRGGLRAAVEVEVNNRVRATLQKNFSLPEDTKFELEYDATDNITVRTIRDERRDLACEVEMRWKF